MSQIGLTLIYTSTASYLFSEDDIKGILNTSRKWNNVNGLSGLLLYKDGNIIQVLEGDKKAVESIFSKIEKDTRHRQVSILAKKTIVDREFKNWHMDFLDISTLTEEERESYSSFLNEESFNQDFLQSSPTRAYILLSGFRKVMSI